MWKKGGRRVEEGEDGDPYLGAIREVSKKFVAIVRADNYWLLSQWKEHQELMIKDLVEDARRWEWKFEPASLWWTGS